MTAKSFIRPVPVFVGLGFPYDVSSVLEAYKFLEEWTGSRSPMYRQRLPFATRLLLATKTLRRPALRLKLLLEPGEFLLPTPLSSRLHAPQTNG